MNMRNTVYPTNGNAALKAYVADNVISYSAHSQKHLVLDDSHPVAQRFVATYDPTVTPVLSASQTLGAELAFICVTALVMIGWMLLH